MDDDLCRRRILAQLDEMVMMTRELRQKGIDPGQREDKEATAIVKRITAKAYEG